GRAASAPRTGKHRPGETGALPTFPAERGSVHQRRAGPRAGSLGRIGEGLDQALPRLRELILTNNSLVEQGDLDPLASLKSLTYLSILRNPVTNKKHYRLCNLQSSASQSTGFPESETKRASGSRENVQGQTGCTTCKGYCQEKQNFQSRCWFAN
uniref:U2A'/phosphoprotein 32 family A C-terminal domain-containing protein n=1 Tax=Canis lupus familiaris TaxID=9615 RepID=A0A8C0QH69_CANLF